MFLKSRVGLVLSKNVFGIRNTQHSTALSVHKQPKVSNTTYALQSHADCPNIFNYLVIFMVIKSNPSFVQCGFSRRNRQVAMDIFVISIINVKIRKSQGEK